MLEPTPCYLEGVSAARRPARGRTLSRPVIADLRPNVSPEPTGSAAVKVVAPSLLFGRAWLAGQVRPCTQRPRGIAEMRSLTDVPVGQPAELDVVIARVG